MKNLFYNGICVNHTGKMEGLASFSTASTTNSFCEMYSKIEGSVCSHCYARNQLTYQHTNEAKCTRNGEYIKHHLMSDSEVPFLNFSYFRFESFGDLETTEQVYNYFKVARKNKHTHFALFTKNAFLIAYAMELYGIKKPSNMQIVFSSILLNKQVDKPYSFIDKVFTVYTKDYIKKHDVQINCCKHCTQCLKCYRKNNVSNIAEVLK